MGDTNAILFVLTAVDDTTARYSGSDWCDKICSEFCDFILFATSTLSERFVVRYDFFEWRRQTLNEKERENDVERS